MKTVPEKEESSTTKGTNSFQEESRKENNGILKGTTASKSYSKEVNDSKKGNKSIRERKEGAFAKINSVDQLDKTRSIRGELPSGGSKCNAKDPGKTKIGDVTMTDGRRQQCSLRNIIGKREQRREELEKVEDDLRQRLDMLECSMPAVMVWNIWRMAQGAPVCRIKRILEKQFENTRELSCRSTPSRHYDCRVREIEAERKLALRKVEEARNLWSEKLVTLEKQKRKLEEARKIQEEQKCAMERLNEEARILQETMERPEIDESCRYGECGDTQCKRRQLDKVSSVTSIKSGDIQCLEKLQRLVEDEMMTKRDIAELERREEAYMRTLQQADELWSKMENDTMSATSTLQEQLNMKTAANQQLAARVCELEDALEKCRTRMAACRTELEKFLSIEKVEATIGRDDDVAEVTDKEVIAKVKVVHRPIGKVDDVATVEDAEVLAKAEVKDEETLTKVEVADEEALARIALIDVDVEAVFVGDDKYISAIPDVVDIGIDRPMDLVRVEDAEGVVQPEDFAYEEQRFKEVREYLAKLDSLEDLYKDDGEPCAPDFICNDVVPSPTGMTDEELTTLRIEPTALKEFDRKLVVSEEEREKPFQKELMEKPHDIVEDIEKKEKKVSEIPDVKTVEREIVEKTEALIAEVVIAKPAREIVTRRTIEEDAAVDRPITIPDDVKLPEIKKDEQDVVVQRDTILSWVDTIDTIREKAAKHSDCHAVKKDADILAKEVSAYVGIKPKEIQEEDVTIAAEKILVKERSPIELIAEPELLPKLTKEELPIIPIEENLKDDTVPQLSEINELEIPVVEKLKEIPQLNKIRMADETAAHVEIVETKEIAEAAEVPPIAEVKEAERDNAEEAIPIVMIEKVKEIRKPEEVLPTIDLTKKEKLELLMADVEEVPIADVVEETIKVEKLPLTLDIEEEKIEVAELPVITNEVEKKVIEDEEPSPIVDMIKEDELETVQPVIQPPLVIKKEEEFPIVEKLPEIELIKVEEPSVIADTIKEEIETVQPVIQPPAIIEKEVALPIVEELPEIELPKIELIEVQEVYEEKEEEEILPVKKKEILETTEVEEIALPTISAVEDKKEKVPVIEKKPEVVVDEVSVEEKVDEVSVEEKVPITETKPSEAKMLTIPIDTRLMTQPFIIVAKIAEKELLHIIPAMRHACIECCSRPRAETTKQVEITRTDVVQTELVQITTQTVTAAEPPRTPPVRIISEYLKPAELKAWSAEIAGDHPEITGRKMLGRKRLKDQSTVTTTGIGSQTDKTSHVSHERVVRDERERARVPTDELLRSIKIAAGLTRPDTEREIRTINYGEISKAVCNCCLCGKTPSLLSIRSKLEIQPQIDAKTATPAAAAAFKRIFIPPKIDRPISYNRLCPDCKVRIQAKMSHQRYHIEKIIKKISRDQESCGCATLTDKPCRAVSRTKTVEKKDQATLAKIPKQKPNAVDQKMTDNLQTILEDPKSLTVQPLSPSCICYKLEKSGIEPVKKGNCYCADLAHT